MSWHIYKEVDIVPVNKTISLRTVLDASGPHMLCMGTRTTVAAVGAGSIGLFCDYEDISGNIQSIATAGNSSLITIDPDLGSTWYMKDSLIMDKYYPLGDGPTIDPLGLFQLRFTLVGSALTSLFSYEAVLQVFDGSPNVVYHP